MALQFKPGECSKEFSNNLLAALEQTSAPNQQTLVLMEIARSLDIIAQRCKPQTIHVSKADIG